MTEVSPLWFVVCPVEEEPLGDPRVSAFDRLTGMPETFATRYRAECDRSCGHAHSLVQGAPQAWARLREVRAS